MQARADLAASRARIVAATDAERRHVVRDLHRRYAPTGEA